MSRAIWVKFASAEKVWWCMNVTVKKSQVHPNVFHTVSLYIWIRNKEHWGDASGMVLQEKTLDRCISTFWVGWKYLEWPNPALASISQPTSVTCMHQWVSLPSQPYRKCQDVSDLLPALLAAARSHLHLPLARWHCSTKSPVREEYQMLTRWKPHTQWKLLLRSWLAGA